MQSSLHWPPLRLSEEKKLYTVRSNTALVQAFSFWGKLLKEKKNQKTEKQKKIPRLKLFLWLLKIKGLSHPPSN